MANTPISVRLSEELLREIDASANRLGVSRNWVISRRLEQWVDIATGKLPVGEVAEKKRSREDQVAILSAEEFDRREEADFVLRVTGGGINESDTGTGNGGDVCGAEVRGSGGVGVEGDGDRAEGGGTGSGHGSVSGVAGGASEGATGVGPRLRRVGKRVGPHLLTANDGSTAHCNPLLCKFCDEESGNRKAKKNGRVPAKFSEKRLREMAEPGGLMACSPELLTKMKEDAKVNSGTAALLHTAGVELDREILVRWGLAENYKPALPDSFGQVKPIPRVEGMGPLTAEDKKGFSAKTIQELKDICAGKTPQQIDDSEDTMGGAQEVDLCGFKSYNDVDGENYICGLEKHGPKVKHGDWIKV